MVANSDPTPEPDVAPPRDPTPPAESRFEAPSVIEFGLTAFAFFVIILGGGLPTPLYVIYQKAWGFSPGILTVIFAAYAAGLLLMLLTFGRLSDRIGRRPVLVLSVVVAIGSTIVFLLASNVGWLIVARVLSGMSVGLCANTASAALTEFEPHRDRNRAALTVAVITAVGVGVGPFYAGILAQYAPDPLTLSYWVLLGLLVAALGAALAIREPHRESLGSTGPMHRWIRVPHDIRPIFVLAGLAAFIGFALAGIFSGLAPSFLAVGLKITNHSVSGATVLLMFGTAAVVPLLLHRRVHHQMMRLGATCVPLGLIAITFAVWTGVALPFVLGTVVCGAGFGLCLRGGIGLLNHAAPPDQRAEVLSAFYVAAYLGLSVPVVGIGVLANVAGLPTAALVLSTLISLLAVPVLLAKESPSHAALAGQAAPSDPPESRDDRAPGGVD